MDTPSNNSKKSWNALLSSARQAAPPAGIDVRFALRRALEAEIATAPRQDFSLWQELVNLTGQAWLRGLLGGSALAAIPLLSFAVPAGRDLLEILRLASPLLVGF